VKVLLIDDWPVFALALQRTLREELQGDEVVIRHRPTAAIDLKGLDLVITDFHMPGMNGLELLQWLRKANPEMHTIVYSSLPEEVRDHRLQHEADHIISKLSRDRLKTVVLAVKAEHVAAQD